MPTLLPPAAVDDPIAADMHARADFSVQRHYEVLLAHYVVNRGLSPEEAREAAAFALPTHLLEETK